MPKPPNSNRRYKLEDLRVFLAVADAGSISVGAAHCFLAPSSVSERLSTMESALGIQLLDRLQRGVRPTPAGRILMGHARRCLAQLEQLHADLASYTQAVRGRVTLFANSTALSSTVPRALETFFRTNPMVDVELFEQQSEQTIEAVISGAADVGVVNAAADSQHADLRFIPLCTDELVVIAAPSHAVASRKTMRFTDCLEQHFIGLRDDASFHRFIQDRARRIRRTVQYRVQVTEFIALGSLVAAGVGISIVPRSLTTQLDARLRLIPLNEPWAVRQLYICAQAAATSSNPHIDELIEHIRRQG